MLTEQSPVNSNEFIEAELSQVEEHMLQLLDNMNQDIIWVNHTKKGIVPGALNILKNFYSDIEAFHILDALVRKGMLNRIDNGILLLCPSCGSHESSIIESCPSCSSIKLSRKHKLVHTPCEHWGTFDEFQVGNIVTCPVCSEEIESDKILENKSGFSYSDPYYECQECNFSSNKVRSQFLCTSCKTKFQASNAVELEQTGFSVTVEPIKEQKHPKTTQQIEVPSSMEETAPSEETPPRKTNTSTERNPIKLLDDIEKNKNKKAQEKKKSENKIHEKTPIETESLPTETEQKLGIKPDENIEPIKKVEDPETEIADSISLPEVIAPHITPDPVEETVDPEIEVKIVPKPIEEKLETELIEPSVNEIEEEKAEYDELEELEDLRGTIEKGIVEESEPKEIIEEVQSDETEKMGEKGHNVLFVVENQMVCNFVLEGLERSETKIELNLVEDGLLALKDLRRVYDMIIFDSGLKSVDPSFVIEEMIKKKIKSPIVIIDEGTIGRIPRNLKVVAILKRKPKDLRKITQIISNIN